MTPSSAASPILARIADADPAVPFWIGETDRWSWGDLSERVDAWCGLFDLAELSPGDTVVAATRDDWSAATLFIAAILDGLVPTVLSPEASDARITIVVVIVVFVVGFPALLAARPGQPDTSGLSVH